MKEKKVAEEVNNMTSADTVYGQLCESYRAIDDFRSKLLALLPAITGASILLTSKEYPNLLKEWAPQFGVFGGLITCGLFIYEIYGIRKCAALISTGEELEILGQIHGQFRTRPPSVLGWINEPTAAAIIYPVVLASWWVVGFLRILSVQTISLSVVGVWVVAALLVLGGFLGLHAYDRSLNKKDKPCCAACGRPL